MIIEWRNANGDLDRIPELVADLVQSKVDVIVVETTPCGARSQTRDEHCPCCDGARRRSSRLRFGRKPGASWWKRHRALNHEDRTQRQAVAATQGDDPTTRPASRSYGIQIRRGTPKSLRIFKSAAPKLSIALSFSKRANARGTGASLLNHPSSERAGAVSDRCPLFSTHRAMLLELASKARLPMIESERRFVDAGGLMSYGANLGDLYRRSAGYVDKILKGAKPGDLPVEQPTKFELVVNLKTAKALGLTIPQSVLLRADEVIR